ncbi:MAG: nitroreductase family protein [Chloroflexota bacterium]|nr:nitroreductase family protein [Chloroflexota bacterium]
MEVMEAILERRSVRKLKATPVSDDVLTTILEAGRWAPSWANTQCSRFVVVRDPTIKAQIAEAKAHGNNPASETIRNAPVLIVICGELQKSGYYKGQQTTDKGDWYMFDTALAAQNMMLAAHSLGLGAVPIGLFDAAKVNQILDIPSGANVVALIPMGYPDEEPKAPRRKELSELVSYEKYQQK